MRSVVHPGPVASQRIQIAPCSGRPITIELLAGIALEYAVAAALEEQGVDSAWLDFSDVPFEQLCYVIPDRSPDEQHVAWYSDKYEFAQGNIDRLGMIAGWHEKQFFSHSHGHWTDQTGKPGMGHLLAPQTYLSAPTIVSGIGLYGAIFDRRHDPETNFELFHVENTESNSNEGCDQCAAVRLLPNQDFSSAIDQACYRLGWQAARVHGLGSLIGAHLEDGQTLDSLATEFLITDAEAGLNTPEPEIIIVGFESDRILSGRLARGENALLVTAELVMSRQGE